MNKKVYCNQYHCSRCRHTWISRVSYKPKQCPHCKSRVWDKKRK